MHVAEQNQHLNICFWSKIKIILKLTPNVQMQNIKQSWIQKWQPVNNKIMQDVNPASALISLKSRFWFVRSDTLHQQIITTIHVYK